MAGSDSDRGPKFVWNFPLIRRIQNGNGLLSIGANIIQKRQESKDTNTDEDFSQSTSDESGDVLDQIDSSIDDLKDDSEAVFSQGDSTTVVEVTEDGFSPGDAEIDTGGTVEWVNLTDSDIEISSTNNTRVKPEVIPPEEKHSETFYTNVVIEYKNLEGSQKGTITVGDPNMELDIERVPFSSEENATRSMTEAVLDKDDQDSGF